jgi:hypothetical protein
VDLTARGRGGHDTGEVVVAVGKGMAALPFYRRRRRRWPEEKAADREGDRRCRAPPWICAWGVRGGRRKQEGGGGRTTALGGVAA